jgi:hypothetical protein
VCPNLEKCLPPELESGRNYAGIPICQVNYHRWARSNIEKSLSSLLIRVRKDLTIPIGAQGTSCGAERLSSTSFYPSSSYLKLASQNMLIIDLIVCHYLVRDDG